MKRRVVNVLTTTSGGGGAEKQLLLSVLGLSARGASCHVFGLRPASGNARYGSLIDECRAAGVTFHLPGRAGPGGAALVVFRLLLHVAAAPSSILWVWGYRAQLLHLMVPVLWLPRTVVALRSADPEITPAQHWIIRLGRRLTWQYLSNSERAVQYADDSVPGVAAKARVVHNAIEGLWFERGAAPRPRPTSTLQVVMLGNVRYLMKGYDVALAVAERIQALGLPVQIRIGGKQYLGEVDLHSEIVRRGLSETVRWEGAVESPEQLLGSADVFLLLSRVEGMSNSLMEAMALGLPCIATDVGDVAQFRRHSDCLRMVPVLEVEQVVEQLKTWIANPGEAAAVGRRAYRFAESHFLLPTMLDRVEEAFGWREADVEHQTAGRDAAAA